MQTKIEKPKKKKIQKLVALTRGELHLKEKPYLVRNSLLIIIKLVIVINRK